MRPKGIFFEAVMSSAFSGKRRTCSGNPRALRLNPSTTSLSQESNLSALLFSSFLISSLRTELVSHESIQLRIIFGKEITVLFQCCQSLMLCMGFPFVQFFSFKRRQYIQRFPVVLSQIDHLSILCGIVLHLQPPIFALLSD